MSTPFTLSIEKNKMEAYLTIQEGSNGEVTAQSALDYLHNAGVVAEVDSKIVEEAIAQRRWGEKFKVAKGRESVPGKDGYVEYFFRTDKERKPRQKENGSVDFHDLMLVENVIAGQKLAKVVPPTEGEPGQNILGETIPAIKGKLARIVPGRNTTFTDENKTLLQSTVNGYIKLRRDGSVEVDTVFTVEKHVDYSTGDINVNGDVIIRGDVKAGFKVKASGNIEVRGVVEDAELLAGGNVIVRGGVVGQGKGFIKARGDISLNFIHNQKISSVKNIKIEQESVQANLTAGGSIIMSGSKGYLIGGIAQATKSAEINVIGNEQYANTVLIVGNTEKLETQIMESDKELMQNDDNLKKVKTKISELMELKMKMPWTQELEQTYRSLERLLVQLPQRSRELLKQKEELQKQIQQIAGQAFIKVNKRVFPGVSFKIAGCPRKFESEWGPSIFRVVDNELVGLPL
jgi:uncharacterized protein (DUF342 family)